MYLRECETKIGDAPVPQPPLPLPQACQKQLKGTKVAVVGGGFAGLMATLRLRQHGINVTVFEARPQVGGRVLSNRTWSPGRITEEGAELIGSFHTTWLALAREHGLTMISRMDPDLYQRAGLDVKIRLGRDLSMDEIIKLGKEMDARLTRIAQDAALEIPDSSRPWDYPSLIRYDNMSVAFALETKYQVKRDGLLWKLFELKLVNDEVAPLDGMNFLGLLCKVKGGQGKRFGTGLPPILRGYWDELEIFRCADGCDMLAKKMAEKIPKAELRLRRAVTHISLSKRGVVLGSKQVINHKNGALADGPPLLTNYDYVILAIPPSVWDKVTITADGKNAHPNDEIGKIGMAPAVKFFSEVKERFWIKEGAAPYGGSSTLGQVWEGTDNQTQVGQQRFVLSVFAGPILPGPHGPRVPTEREFRDRLRELYPGYASNLIKTKPSDWPNEPFIKTGYVSPRKGEIFKIGKKLSEPFHGRLFFAGEHTQMDFFGYMEGALRSGNRAAEQLMQQSCGLRQEPAPAEPSRVRIAGAAPIREKMAF